MSKPVNLNMFRKAKAKLTKKQTARENSERFGQSKGKRSDQSHQAIRDDRFLDAHRLDD